MKKTIKTWLNFLLIAGFVMILTTSCKKSESPTDPTQTTNGAVKDIDGNSYTTVTIGTQVWMVENLKTTKYRNGDAIPNVTDDIQWEILTTGAYCNYKNDVAMGNKYGKLYNYFAVYDSRKLAPTGWHIPSDVEWDALSQYLQTNVVAGAVGRALSGENDWFNYVLVGDSGKIIIKNNYNSSGFTALAGGGRFKKNPSSKMEFSEAGNVCIWWSTNKDIVMYEYLSRDYERLQNWSGYKELGISIRCIKD